MDTNNQLKYDQIIEALGGVSEITQAAATAAEAAATAAAVIVGVANQSVSTVVSTFADIPLSTTPDAALYLVLESSGGMFGNQNPAGFYRQVGNPPVWTFIGPNSNGLMANVVVTNSPTVELEDGSGNAISSTLGSLNVNVTNSTPGSATAANQIVELTALSTIATNTSDAITAATNAATAAATVVTTVANAVIEANAATTNAAALLLAAQAATTAATTTAASLLLSAQALTEASIEALTKPSDIQLVDGSAHVQPVSGTVAISNFPPPIISTAATVLAEAVTTTPTLLLGTNLNRKGLAIQNTNQITFIKLDSTVSTALYSYELPKKGILEIENYCGPVTAVTASGSTIVMVTEKV